MRISLPTPAPSTVPGMWEVLSKCLLNERNKKGGEKRKVHWWGWERERETDREKAGRQAGNVSNLSFLI